jgi:hypothetical protein
MALNRALYSNISQEVVMKNNPFDEWIIQKEHTESNLLGKIKSRLNPFDMWVRK